VFLPTRKFIIAYAKPIQSRFPFSQLIRQILILISIFNQVSQNAYYHDFIQSVSFQVIKTSPKMLFLNLTPKPTHKYLSD